MRRTLAAITVLLLSTLTACGSGGNASTADHASPTPAKASRAHATHKSDAPKSCGPLKDVIVWTHTPGIPDSAAVLGGRSLATCESTFDSLPTTSPTEAGYCTEAAWASDNPGYNADARPAEHLKKVQITVGPAC